VGILAASVIAGTAGFIYLSLSPGEPEPLNHEGTKD
jgi:hypothetical protein